MPPAIVLAAGERYGHPEIVHKYWDKYIVGGVSLLPITAGADRVIVVVGNHADEIRSCTSCFLTLNMLPSRAILAPAALRQGYVKDVFLVA